jgi:hypothetical protein
LAHILLDKITGILVGTLILIILRKDVIMNTKNVVTVLILILFSIVTLPVLAQSNAPQTPEDCQRIYEGDDELIRACIDYVNR